jgi:hypothetical protein
MTELQFISQTLEDADKAVAVLSTMLAKASLRHGFLVADEIAGNIKTARKHIAHLIDASDSNQAETQDDSDGEEGIWRDEQRQ